MNHPHKLTLPPRVMFRNRRKRPARLIPASHWWILAAVTVPPAVATILYKLTH